MKVAVILVAVVMVLNVDGWWWMRRSPRYQNVPNPTIPVKVLPMKGIVPLGPSAAGLGKRGLGEAESGAAFDAAAEDGVLSDDEIKSVLGVADEDLADFYELYDVNDNGEITVVEFQTVSVVLENMKGEEEEQ